MIEGRQHDATCGDNRRRESNFRSAMIVSTLGAVIIVVYVLCKVLDTVLGERGIGLKADPISSFYTALQLYACTIRLRHVGTCVSTHIIHFTRQHQLVFVIHVIEVRAGAPDV